jgi:hypothetical protein
MTTSFVQVSDIRKAFKDQLEGITGLTPYATMPANPHLPCVVPIPYRWEYDDTFDGTVHWTFRLYFYLPNRDLNSSQLAFDSYIQPGGPNSVPARLERDPSLGGVVESLRVVGGEYLSQGPLSADGTTHVLGAYLTVEVLVP